MPAIRAEEWATANSVGEGVALINKGEACVRFSGLFIDDIEKVDFDQIFDALVSANSKCESIGFDWLTLKPNSLSRISTLLSKSPEENSIRNLILNKVNLGTIENFQHLQNSLKTSSLLLDLDLAFSSITDEIALRIADILKGNTTLVSLNLSLNFLTLNGLRTIAEALNNRDDNVNQNNNTLRYLEIKENHFSTADACAVLPTFEQNTSLELLDIGQHDSVDGNIPFNVLTQADEEDLERPEKESIVSETLKGTHASSSKLPPVDSNRVLSQNNEADRGNETFLRDLSQRITALLQRNKERRKISEKSKKLKQLDELLDSDLKNVYASLKHCKILVLGLKGSAKTFTLHSLLHKVDLNSKPTLNSVTLAKMAEVGWVKVSKLDHVEMILAKYLSNLPENKRDRYLANETLFQVENDVIINDKDVAIKGSVLKAKNENLLQRITEETSRKETNILTESELTKLNLNAVSNASREKAVFSEEEKATLKKRFEEKMDELMDKSRRENFYPSFSIWDFGANPSSQHLVKLLMNTHGLIFYCFDLRTIMTEPELVIKTILQTLQPIINNELTTQFSAKVMLLGTFFEDLLNENDVAALQAANKSLSFGLDFNKVVNKDNHISFLLNNLISPESIALLTEVGKLLINFSFYLEKNLGKNVKFIVKNEEMETLFFTVANRLPKICEAGIREDFDDICGLNRVRSRVKELVQKNELSILNEMVSIRFSKVVDMLHIQKALYEEEKAKLAEKKSNLELPRYKPFLTLREVQNLCSESAITSPTEIFEILNYLHETGVVFWLGYSEQLRHLIFIDPEYFLDSLKPFFGVITDTNMATTTLEALKTEILKSDLGKDLELFVNKRVITHDLLFQTLITSSNRKNMAYFSDLLKYTFTINKVDIQTVMKLCDETNLINSTSYEHEDMYLVPAIGSFKPSVETEFFDIRQFSKFQTRFTSKNCSLIPGAFERTFALIIEALKTSPIADKHNEDSNSKRVINLNPNSATFQFGKLLLTFLVKLPEVSVIEASDIETSIKINSTGFGYFLFEFSNEEVVELLFEKLVKILRKVEIELSGTLPEFEFTSEVLVSGNKWMNMNSAQKDSVEPYFSKRSKQARNLFQTHQSILDGFVELDA